MNRMIVKDIVKRHVIRKVTKMFALLVCFVRPAVVTLTNENFTDFIENSSLPIFLKLWATWCPHCKEFAPVWDELGTRLFRNLNLPSPKKGCSFPAPFLSPFPYAAHRSVSGTPSMAAAFFRCVSLFPSDFRNEAL